MIQPHSCTRHMERAVASPNIFRFGLFEADAANGTLMRNGVRVRIQDQPFRVLIFLLEQPGEIVTREQLRQRLWPEGTYVDFDGSLNVILKKLRAAVDDASDNPRFIETVPRRGYRFIAPVALSAARTESSAPVSALGNEPVTQLPVKSLDEPGKPPWGYLSVVASALAVLVVIAMGWVMWHRKQFVIE